MNEKFEDRPLERSYQKAFDDLGAIQSVFPVAAKIEMAKMVEQIARSDSHLNKIINTDQGLGIRAGFAAEEVHAESFNLDSIFKENKTRAYTDDYSEFFKHGYKDKDPRVDTILTDGTDVLHESQSKYYQNAEETAKTLRQLGKDGKPKYGDVDSHVGPSDQINPTDGSKNVSDHARRTALKEEYKGERPQVAKAARNVERKATDRLQHDGVESTPLSKKGAEKIAKGDNEFRDEIHSKYQTSSTIKQMGKAAKGAACISAVASGTLNTVMYLKMVREGKISEGEAVLKIMGETASSAADSALKAAANTGAQSMLVKHGSTETAKLMAKQGVRSLARTNAVSIAVICGIDLIKDMVRLSAGKIDSKQFEERNGKNLFQTSASVMGASVGTSMAGGLSWSIAPLLGGMAGGLIAGIAMSMAIENHIEKPFRELVDNTAAVEESMRVFQEVSDRLVKGQKVFQAALVEEAKLDRQFASQLRNVDDAGRRMSNSIDKLESLLK